MRCFILRNSFMNKVSNGKKSMKENSYLLETICQCGVSCVVILFCVDTLFVYMVPNVIPSINDAHTGYYMCCCQHKHVVCLHG